jgi:hypothetical protein
MEFLVLGGAMRCERVVSHKVFAFALWFVSKKGRHLSRGAPGDASRSGYGKTVIAVLARKRAMQLQWNAGLKPSAYTRSKLVVDSASRCRQIHLAKIRAW